MYLIENISSILDEFFFFINKFYIKVLVFDIYFFLLIFNMRELCFFII